MQPADFHADLSLLDTDRHAFSAGDRLIALTNEADRLRRLFKTMPARVTVDLKIPARRLGDMAEYAAANPLHGVVRSYDDNVGFEARTGVLGAVAHTPYLHGFVVNSLLHYAAPLADLEVQNAQLQITADTAMRQFNSNGSLVHTDAKPYWHVGPDFTERGILSVAMSTQDPGTALVLMNERHKPDSAMHRYLKSQIRRNHGPLPSIFQHIINSSKGALVRRDFAAGQAFAFTGSDLHFRNLPPQLEPAPEVSADATLPLTQPLRYFFALDIYARGNMHNWRVAARANGRKPV